jgi:Collagen triple helix repeat (20 copies)
MTRGFVRFLRRNTIALLALFLALGGTTYAASTGLIGKNSVASPQVVNGSLQTKDLSKKARKALKGNRGPRGLTGAPGAQGDRGATGAQGVKGDTGAPGEALAFAGVHANGTLFTPANLAKNITAANISHPATGVYCFHGLPFTPRSAMATGANGFGTNFIVATVEINGRDGGVFTGECLSTDQARVRTVVVPSGGAYSPSVLADSTFYVWFD